MIQVLSRRTKNNPVLIGDPGVGKTAIVDGLAPTFSYRFIGDTPLGGTRTTDKAMRLWFERLYRLFPGSQFAPQTIVVEGPPWNTRIMTYVKINGVVPTDGGGELSAHIVAPPQLRGFQRFCLPSQCGPTRPLEASSLVLVHPAPDSIVLVG